MNTLLDRLKKSSKIKESAVLADSKFFSDTEQVSTDVPMLNIALSGSIDGGLSSGLTTLAGKSRHFKTSYALIMAAAYLEKYSDAMILFYDSEFGSPQSYFKNFGIDTSRVLHSPVANIEELKFDIVNQLNQIERKDKVIIVIDSIGNIASKKEVDDAINEKSVADMTRAKAIKGLFRMVTPILKMNDIPAIAIAHTYECGTKEMTVQTPEGNVSLADIKVGDTVQTECGWEKVSYTMSQPDADITEITLEDGEVLSFTEGHRFKVNGEWKYLTELMPGDVLDEVV
jgi:RecA/RadA recombinase